MMLYLLPPVESVGCDGVTQNGGTECNRIDVKKATTIALNCRAGGTGGVARTLVVAMTKSLSSSMSMTLF